MLLGRPIGQAAPYYFQPLYPYFVALVHLLLGEPVTPSMVVGTTVVLAGVTLVMREEQATTGN